MYILLKNILVSSIFTFQYGYDGIVVEIDGIVVEIGQPQPINPELDDQ